MSVEKYSCYKFKVFKPTEENSQIWHYLIYSEGCWPYDDGIINCDEWYDTEQEARFAAIGHITLLENGESNA